mgnify:CR=1 FL=1
MRAGRRAARLAALRGGAYHRPAPLVVDRDRVERVGDTEVSSPAEAVVVANAPLGVRNHEGHDVHVFTLTVILARLFSAPPLINKAPQPSAAQSMRDFDIEHDLRGGVFVGVQDVGRHRHALGGRLDVFVAEDRLDLHHL